MQPNDWMLFFLLVPFWVVFVVLLAAHFLSYRNSVPSISREDLAELDERLDQPHP